MNQNPYQATRYSHAPFVAQAEVADRVTFIRSTYLHLALAIAAFVLIDALLLTVFNDRLEPIVMMLFQGWNWLLFMGGIIGVSYLANHWAHSGASKQMQYAGLSLYVVAEAIMFVPLLWMANNHFPGSIQSAAIVTMVVFGGLTATVFITKADFSFLRMGLSIGMFAAFGLVLVAVIMPGSLNLGVWFSIAMIVLAAGYILYTTSNILHHYRTDQPVAAALALFAAVALLFWYVLRLFMQRD